MKHFIVSGLAGSGKSVALGMLEDIGYYCIDNLPISLLRDLTIETLRQQAQHFERIAVGVDARSLKAEIAGFPERIAALRNLGVDIGIIFLQADPEVILRRYEATRRKHPLTSAKVPLAQAVEADRELMQPIADRADIVIDTSRTNVHQLRDLIRTRVGGSTDDGMSIMLQSFGFKHGLPEAVDFVFDVRCLPNPHWEPALRDATGRDPDVAAFLENKPETERMLADIGDFIETWLPAFQRENRAYVTIAVGCTGGQHRSVYLVERLGERLRPSYPNTIVSHAELP